MARYATGTACQRELHANVEVPVRKVHSCNIETFRYVLRCRLQRFYLKMHNVQVRESKAFFTTSPGRTTAGVPTSAAFRDARHFVWTACKNQYGPS